MQRFIASSYGRIAIMDNERDAPAIVFLHGNSYCKEAFARQFDSAELKGFRLLALDLPGHGASDDAQDPEQCYCMRHYARMVREVLATLAVRPCVIFGWSLGGHIAIEALAQGLQSTGLLICGTPPFGPGTEGMESAFLPSEHMELTGKPEFDAGEARRYAVATLGSADFATLVQRCDGRARLQMLSDWTSPGAGHDAVDFIASWPGTLAVLHGRDEPFVSLPYLQGLPWNNLWRQQVQVLEDCGHAPFWQQAERVNRLLGDFATECAAEGATE